MHTSIITAANRARADRAERSARKALLRASVERKFLGKARAMHRAAVYYKKAADCFPGDHEFYTRYTMQAIQACIDAGRYEIEANGVR